MSAEAKTAEMGREIGRYVLFDELASGGMASVHIGRLMGTAGFTRTVAIKRLHAQHAKNRDFVAMLLDEARLATRIRHPNVVPVLDIVQDVDELLLVMEYIPGDSLSSLFRAAKERGLVIPQRIVRAVISSVLHGLHAAHESVDERGAKLELVHRDVSPQNVIVGADGVTRVLDFGIAKAVGRLQTTRDGEVKGKAAYMSPEQISGTGVDRRTDIYAASVMLWEILVGERLFTGDSLVEILSKVLGDQVDPPSKRASGISPALDAIVVRGMDRAPEKRFSTAREMAIAIEDLGDIATAREIGEWVESIAKERLDERAARIAEIESATFAWPTRDSLPSDERADERAPVSSRSGSVTSSPISGSGKRAKIPDEVETISAKASVVTPPSVPPAAVAPASSNSSRVILAVIGVALVAALYMLVFRKDDPPRTDALVRAAPSASAPVSAASSAPPSAPAASSAPALLTSVSPPPSASAAPSRTTHPVIPTGTAPLATKRPNCDPSYTLDAKGIRIPKPECL